MDTMQKAYAEFVKGLCDGERAKLQAALDEYNAKQEQPKKKTGYERAKTEENYYCTNERGVIGYIIETNDPRDKELYDAANYYSDETVAENNARADKLLRQLRRFAVEHRENELDWSSCNKKYFIYCDYDYETMDYDDGYCLHITSVDMNRHFGQVYFDSRETAELALKTFEDELTWYFTEYKDSL